MKKFMFIALLLTISGSAYSMFCNVKMIDMTSNYTYEEYEAQGVQACNAAKTQCDEDLKNRGLLKIAKCFDLSNKVFFKRSIHNIFVNIPKTKKIITPKKSL